MPHVNIKHFPASLTTEQRTELADAVTTAISKAFGCADRMVSIAVEPVAPEDWTDRVYQPEVVDRPDTLIKTPNY
jgi:4-oxalocrotonate tautomerase